MPRYVVPLRLSMKTVHAWKCRYGLALVSGAGEIDMLRAMPHGASFKRPAIILLMFMKRSGRSAVGSAPALGAGCRRFESCRPDHFINNTIGPLAQLVRASSS